MSSAIVARRIWREIYCNSAAAVSLSMCAATPITAPSITDDSGATAERYQEYTLSSGIFFQYMPVEIQKKKKKGSTLPGGNRGI